MQIKPQALLELSYYGYDGHGNVRFLMDTNGSITDTYTYDAFGNLINSMGSTTNDYLYCGLQFDWVSGLYNNRARRMFCPIGRFTTMDGDYGNNEDPLSLHKYLYTQDDPVDHVDSSGHQIDELCLAMEIISGLDALPNILQTLSGAGTPPSPPLTVTLDMIRTFNANESMAQIDNLLATANSLYAQANIKFVKGKVEAWGVNEVETRCGPSYTLDIDTLDNLDSILNGKNPKHHCVFYESIFTA